MTLHRRSLYTTGSDGTSNGSYWNGYTLPVGSSADLLTNSLLGNAARTVGLRQSNIILGGLFMQQVR